MDSPHHTFHWAPEIEQATVSILWHEPERLAEFLRVCDPLIHLYQPSLRIILEAIGIAYGELNCADWATVIEVVRELGQFKECGGSQALNEVYSATESGLRYTDIVFADYLRMLKTYAEHRQMDPPQPVHRFSGGRGTAWRNKIMRKAHDPDYIGEAIVRGVRYLVQIKVKSGDDTVNFWLEPK